MGHEVIMYGVVIGATLSPGENFRSLYPLNAKVINSLPSDDDYPWVDGSMFAMPGDYPNGTYRRQAIHFGLTIKDEPNDLDGFIKAWLTKFEAILKQLYWFSARLHVERDFSLECQYLWMPSESSLAALREEIPRPITQWDRRIRYYEPDGKNGE